MCASVTGACCCVVVYGYECIERLERAREPELVRHGSNGFGRMNAMAFYLETNCLCY